MLINTIIFVFIIITYGIIAFTSIQKSEKISFLQTYSKSLNNIARHYSIKHDEFQNLMLVQYEDSMLNIAMQKFLENEDDTIFYKDPFLIKNLQNLLQIVCNKDIDIAAIFIYKSVNNSLYVYQSGTSTIQKVAKDYPYYNELANKTPIRASYSIEKINLTINNIKKVNSKSTGNVYGIAGTLNIPSYATSKKVDSIMVAYKADGIDNELIDKKLDPKGRFLIYLTDGKIIYDSYGKYESKDVALTNQEYQKLIESNGQINLGGVECYTEKYIDTKNGFVALYYIPTSSTINRAIHTGTYVIISVILFCFTAVIIFIVSTKLFSKRMKKLEIGMKQIAINNYDYRIPEDKNKDEFTLIAEKFNYMCEELQETIEKVYLYEIKQKSAEFHSLQTSINPHFLYNTLEAVKIKLTEAGNDEAADMIVMLARLFQFQTKGKSIITIDDELTKSKLYIEFFLLRYDYRFNYKLNISNEVLSYGIPQYTMQPILENYFVHGMRDAEDNEIIISGVMVQDCIEISFEDNGKGIEQVKLLELQEKLNNEQINEKDSYGLLNVHERLKIIFGKPFGLTVESNGVNKGTKVTIKLKAIKADKLENTSDLFGKQLKKSVKSRKV